MSSNPDFADRSLPKWPQMVVTGEPVTLEQAKEIIRRTDTFFSVGYGGNDRAYEAQVVETLGMPDTSYAAMDKLRDTPEECRKRFDALDAWRARWGVIRTNYVNNSWVSCSFIGGPHGWCHPNGRIGFVDNVGKWPDITEIQNDWATLAKAFPFLCIDVTLYDGESGEESKTPVVSMRIRNGEVTLCEPDTDVHKGHAPPDRGNDSINDDAVATYMANFHRGLSREHGLPFSWFEEWARTHAPKTP